MDVYVNHLKAHGENINEEFLKHLSPLGWSHIHLTGDYVWRRKTNLKKENSEDLEILTISDLSIDFKFIIDYIISML